MRRCDLATAAACAAIALGTPVAQAHLEGNWSYGAAVKSTASLRSSSQSTLAVMHAAGTSFHASAAKAQQSFRPNDRAGVHGI
jgi:hypothetical protein